MSGAAVVPARCRNCDTPLAGAYCAACGQRDAPPNPTLRELAADAWDALAGLDGKLVASLRLLFTRPGALTAEHLAGRRARYFAPVKLYLTCSLAFFLLQTVLPEEDRTVHVGSSVTGVSGTKDPLSPDDAKAGVAGPEWGRRIQRGTRRANADGKAFGDRMLERAPQVVFALVPLQALLLAAVYRRRRRNVPAHLVFALHAHAFLFCWLGALGIAAALVRDGRVHGLLDPLGFGVLAAYFVTAMRRVYGGRWLPTLARAAAVAVGYLAGVALVLGGLVVATFYLMGAPARA